MEYLLLGTLIRFSTNKTFFLGTTTNMLLVEAFKNHLLFLCAVTYFNTLCFTGKSDPNFFLEKRILSFHILIMPISGFLIRFGKYRDTTDCMRHNRSLVCATKLVRMLFLWEAQ